jgi:adenylylsulfate kinase
VAAAGERTGARIELLDDDTVGALFPPGGGPADEDLRVRRIAWLASRLEAHGATVVVAIASPGEEARRYARSQAKDFVEIHLHADAAARAARSRTAPDGEPYDAPLQPEIRLDTGRLSVDEAGAEVLAWLEEWSSQS